MAASLGSFEEKLRAREISSSPMPLSRAERACWATL
jgi:hypothetical protein